MKSGKLSIAPLTAERWPDLVELFGERGACGGCWCMYWRLPKLEYGAGKGPANREALHRILEEGQVPGILAYAGSEVAGWCAVAPRQTYVRLQASRALRPIDDLPVWSVSCLFVRRGYRKQGISVALLKHAARFAKESGAQIVEGYPVQPKTENYPEPALWTGTVGAFAAAGYQEAGRGPTGRGIWRSV